MTVRITCKGGSCDCRRPLPARRAVILEHLALDKSDEPRHRPLVVSGDSILYPGVPADQIGWQGEIMKQVCRGVGAILALAICLSSLRADEPDTYNSVQDLEKARKQRVLSSQNIWWEHLIPGRIEEKQKAQQIKANALKEKSADDKDAGKPKPDTASRQTELTKALRRDAVCQRLREIADETNDAEMLKLAELLESRAWAVYEQKMTTAKLARFQPMTEKDVEARLLKNDREKTGASSAQAETDSIRSIRGEKKE